MNFAWRNVGWHNFSAYHGLNSPIETQIRARHSPTERRWIGPPKTSSSEAALLCLMRLPFVNPNLGLLFFPSLGGRFCNIAREHKKCDVFARLGQRPNENKMPNSARSPQCNLHNSAETKVAVRPALLSVESNAPIQIEPAPVRTRTSQASSHMQDVPPPRVPIIADQINRRLTSSNNEVAG